MPQLKLLSELLQGHEFKNDNLHRIAISNLEDTEHRLIRYWSKKYRTPKKPIGDYTSEELMIEYLEDFYDNNPAEIEKFKYMESLRLSPHDNWDGKMPDEYERQIQARLAKIKPVDTSQFESDVELTPEQEKEILANLGLDLPKSKASRVKGDKTIKQEARVLGEDEIDEEFS